MNKYQEIYNELKQDPDLIDDNNAWSAEPSLYEDPARPSPVTSLTDHIHNKYKLPILHASMMAQSLWYYHCDTVRAFMDLRNDNDKEE